MDAASENYRPRLGQLRSVLVRTVARGGAPWGHQDRNAPCLPEPPVAPVIAERSPAADLIVLETPGKLRPNGHGLGGSSCLN